MGAVEAEAHVFVCVCTCINACVLTVNVCVHACIHLSLRPLKLTAPLPATTYSIHAIIKNPTDPGGTPIEKPISFPFPHPTHLPISFSLFHLSPVGMGVL